MPGEATLESAGGGMRPRLERWFSSAEVDRDGRLRIIGGCLLLFFHMTFHDWWYRAEGLSTLGDRMFNAVPAPWVEGYREWVFLGLPATRYYLYALGMLALFGLFDLMRGRSTLRALGILAFLFLNKCYFYLADFRLFANYHHFHLMFTLVFLVSTDKLRFFRLALAACYIMSGLVKLSPSWLLGEHFNFVPGKLPLLPKTDWVVTAASVGVVVMELIGPLFWFTRIRWLQRLSLWAIVLFHPSSGVIIGYFYTTLMLPLVLAAFHGFNEPLQRGYRFEPRHLVPLGIGALGVVGGFWPFVIPGDVRMTAEGRYTGMFMVDAHHSVRSEIRVEKGNKRWDFTIERNWARREGERPPDARMFCVYYQGDVPMLQAPVVAPLRDGEDVIFNPRFFGEARMRLSGDPYLYYHYCRELLRRYQPDRVSVFMEQRLDGHEEAATLLDIEDFGALDPDYNPLWRNPWILLP